MHLGETLAIRRVPDLRKTLQTIPQQLFDRYLLTPQGPVLIEDDDPLYYHPLTGMVDKHGKPWLSCDTGVTEESE